MGICVIACFWFVHCWAAAGWERGPFRSSKFCFVMHWFWHCKAFLEAERRLSPGFNTHCWEFLCHCLQCISKFFRDFEGMSENYCVHSFKSVKISFWYRRILVILWKIVIFRPLKVEIHWSTVSTDDFYTKSISEQQS